MGDEGIIKKMDKGKEKRRWDRKEKGRRIRRGKIKGGGGRRKGR